MKTPISIRASLLRDLTVLILCLGVGIVLATFIGTRRAVRSLSESLVDQTLTTVEARLDTVFADGEQFGTGRLERFVREHHDLAGAELTQELDHAVLAHAAGTEQGDDLTTVLIRRT